MRMFSFRWQLFLAFVLVISIAVGSVALFISHNTSGEIDRYEQKQRTERISRMQTILQYQYLSQHDWSKIQPFVEQMGQLYGWRVIVVADNVVVGDSGQAYLGRHLDPESYSDIMTIDNQKPEDPNQRPRIVFVSKQQPVGGLTVEPLPSAATTTNVEQPTRIGPREFRERQIAELRNSINWSVFWGGLIGVVLAVMLTFFSSRRMTVPIKALADAARHLGKGNLSQRVVIKSRDEFGELANTFNSMAAELERTDELRRNLVADVAHELRTPLANIRGYVEAIQDGVVQVNPDTIKSIYDEVLLLSRLIEDLHELALADAGELTLSCQTTDIGEIAKTAVRGMHPEITARKLKVKLDLP